MAAEMRCRNHDLPAARRIRPAIAAIVKIDLCSIFGFDHSLEIGLIGSIASPRGMVGALEFAGDPALAATSSNEEILGFRGLRIRKRDLPTFRVSKSDTI